MRRIVLAEDVDRCEPSSPTGRIERRRRVGLHRLHRVDHVLLGHPAARGRAPRSWATVRASGRVPGRTPIHAQPELLETARHPDRPSLVPEVALEFADDRDGRVRGELDVPLHDRTDRSRSAIRCSRPERGRRRARLAGRTDARDTRPAVGSGGRSHRARPASSDQPRRARAPRPRRAVDSPRPGPRHRSSRASCDRALRQRGSMGSLRRGLLRQPDRRAPTDHAPRQRLVRAGEWPFGELGVDLDRDRQASSDGRSRGSIAEARPPRRATTTGCTTPSTAIRRSSTRRSRSRSLAATPAVTERSTWRYPASAGTETEMTCRRMTSVNRRFRHATGRRTPGRPMDDRSPEEALQWTCDLGPARGDMDRRSRSPASSTCTPPPSSVTS